MVATGQHMAATPMRAVEELEELGEQATDRREAAAAQATAPDPVEGPATAAVGEQAMVLVQHLAPATQAECQSAMATKRHRHRRQLTPPRTDILLSSARISWYCPTASSSINKNGVTPSTFSSMAATSLPRCESLPR